MTISQSLFYYGYTGRMVGIAEGSVRFAPSGPPNVSCVVFDHLSPSGPFFSGANAYAGEIAGP